MMKELPEKIRGGPTCTVLTFWVVATKAEAKQGNRFEKYDTCEVCNR